VSDQSRREWICREHDVLWEADADGANPGCWVCGAPGEERPLHGLRPGLAVFGGYGIDDDAVRRTR
jgi:hypothetical protein